MTRLEETFYAACERLKAAGVPASSVHMYRVLDVGADEAFHYEIVSGEPPPAGVGHDMKNVLYRLWLTNVNGSEQIREMWTDKGKALLEASADDVGLHRKAHSEVLDAIEKRRR